MSESQPYTINSGETIIESTPEKRGWTLKCIVMRMLIIAIIIALISFIYWEIQTSWLQSWYFSQYASTLKFWVGHGPSNSIRFPGIGPYDQRLGYATLQEYIQRLTINDYAIEKQAQFSPELFDITGKGIFTIYHEKSSAGLTIFDRDTRALFRARYPSRIYEKFESIPDIIIKTLLFIENRELLTEKYPFRNPAIEWDRSARAVLDMLVHCIDKDHKVIGGSTLATQTEKYRHSPRGLTSTPQEKLRQMISASLRAYLGGRETLPARRQIILDYINSIPLAAIQGYGEVNSLGDGLWAWYGVDFDSANRLLREADNDGGHDLSEKARAFKQVLSLFLAHRRPSFYLAENQNALKSLTNEYIHLLFEAGIISHQMREATMKVNLKLRQTVSLQVDIPFSKRKAADVIRIYLSKLLDVPQFYDLDRLDLTVKSTLDYTAQDAVVKIMRDLSNRNYASASGIIGYHMLNGEDIARVIYSFTLYEHQGNINLLRIQADSFDQPFNINEGVKLELGSTAKLRTLVTYLEIIASLHKQYSSLSQEGLLSVHIPGSDRLSRWAIDYLCQSKDKSLMSMLEAAMERRYSAHPDETFFTGGGEHTFENFDSTFDNQILSVREGFFNSVNLVFIRLMRDIVRYYMFQVPGSTAKILEEHEDLTRQVYLSRFADHEGRLFINRFYRKYQNKISQEALHLLIQGVRPIPSHLATIFRSVMPEADIKEFSSFMHAHLVNTDLADKDIKALYEKYSQSAFNLADRGYIARVHPLELWTVEYLLHHQGAPLAKVIEASADERQEVYAWLFKTRKRHAQDIRIRTLLELEAFQEIYRSWKNCGYPFDYIVPSYASAIGSSADRPASLAELVGIILNGGVSYPIVKVQSLHFAEVTPYETLLENQKGRRRGGGEQVIMPEIATVVKKALLGVVEEGTAKRVHQAFKMSDTTPIALGGKTGTGDNRHNTYNARGVLLSSKVINRTATFVFFIGNRFFGTITAYVAGPEGAQYTFTSSLPVQILKVMSPTLMQVINRTAIPTSLALSEE